MVLAKAANYLPWTGQGKIWLAIKHAKVTSDDIPLETQRWLKSDLIADVCSLNGTNEARVFVILLSPTWAFVVGDMASIAERSKIGAGLGL